jgi:hypothetical protein
MKCIVVPEEEKQHEPYWKLANYQLKNLTEFTLAMVH